LTFFGLNNLNNMQTLTVSMLSLAVYFIINFLIIGTIQKYFYDIYMPAIAQNLICWFSTGVIV